MFEGSGLVSDIRPRAVGLLGGGTIGGGWAARYVLSGVDVKLYDPAAASVERVQEILGNARRAYRRMTMAPLPAEGSLTVVGSVAEAVSDVELVQESVPERLELKQQVLGDASRAAQPGTLICSSTSGFRPSLLQEGITHPERLLVAHPFNPVYMLPLVELGPGQQTSSEAVTRAEEIFRSIGMQPMVVEKEIDGFIANRLQEALWREALWLVHDDAATVQQIDDAVRYSFGLRMAIMGPFLSYRMAANGIDMRQFMARFGPKWPWTKFTNVPQLTEEFLDRLAEQSDAQIGDQTIPELERKRDDCLVAVLQGLRTQNYGAGETLARWEKQLNDATPDLVNGPGPLEMPVQEIPSDWTDTNGHVNESRYLQIVSDVGGNLLRHLGVDNQYRSTTGTYFTLETHLSHLRELHAGDQVEVSTQILDADDKRLQLFHVLTRQGDDAPAATAEQLLIHVDVRTGRSAPAQGGVREKVAELTRQHADLPRPHRAGASINLKPTHALASNT